MTDSYKAKHAALVAFHAPELPAADPHEQHAVSVACVVDTALDEMDENTRLLENDYRGLSRR